MTDFRITSMGGVWWLERFHNGKWSILWCPYKRRSGAELRMRKEMAA